MLIFGNNAVKEEELQVDGTFIGATLVDWNYKQSSDWIDEQVKNAIDNQLDPVSISNNRINTFLVSTCEFERQIELETLLSTEEKLQEVYSEYTKQINQRYRDELTYNGDSEVYTSAFDQLDLNDLKIKYQEIKYSVVDLVEAHIEEIVSNASVMIWDMDGHEHDRIVLKDRVISFDQPIHVDLIGKIDEFLITNLARYFLPFSKDLLENAILAFKDLNQIVSNIDEKAGIGPRLKRVVRNFIGSISGFQETIKLFKRQVIKVDTLAEETVTDLEELPSKDLHDWLNHEYGEYKDQLIQLIDKLNQYILEIKPRLRKLLRSNDETIEIQYASLMSQFIEIKAQIHGINAWVKRFEDLPSFTTLSDGIAYEYVENEEYNPSTSEDVILEAQRLFKLYRRGQSTIYALRGVDLKVHEGEFLIIRGPSGAGKTTLLNLLAGLDEAGRGAVFFDNQNIMELSDRKRTKIRRNNFSFIFQDYALIPHLTAYENVELPLQLSNGNDEFSDTIQRLLDGVGIGEYSDHKPAQLSGGQMQRLGIARALVNRPNIIFADEPTGDLDEETGNTVMELLKEYHKNTGITIVLVTHDEKIAEYGTREIYLHDGQITSELNEQFENQISL